MKKIIFALTILIFIVACSDILEENPKAVATETFYTTAAEVEAAVYSIYYPICNAVGRNGGTWVLNLTSVDYGVGRLSYSNNSDFQGLSSTNISRTNSIWQYYYQAIRNANLVIQNAPKATEVPEVQIKQFVAEAKYLRAFSYFYLVRAWGEIPIRTEDNNSDSDVPRSSLSDVYDFILSDLDYAEANLPDMQDITGRPDIYAAKSVLSHVYLQLERWAEARSKALEVINSGRFSLIDVSVPDDFYKIFGVDVDGSSEEIFYLKFSDQATELGSYIARFSHHPSKPEYFNATGVYALYSDSVSNKVIREWDTADLRKKFTLYNCDIGVGSTTMLFKKFINPDAIAQQNGNAWPAYRYPDILFFYAEADCRANNGPSDDGMEKLNMIHRRAYGFNPNETSAVDFNISDYNEESFVDLVLQEALYEQMDEAKRFMNLLRTGKLEQVIKDNVGIDVAESHLLWPIPSTETDYNGAIDATTDQNPGY